MRRMTSLLVLSFALVLSALPAGFGAGVTFAQDQAGSGALVRGYRTGYSDGYAAGYQDSAQKAARDYRNKEEYVAGNRSYLSTYGSIEDYKDGFQQGFESGYNAGFDRRAFDSTIPSSLTRRDNSTTAPVAADDADNSASGTAGNSQVNPAQDNNAPVGVAAGTINIPRDTVMRVELLTNLSTDATQRGDRFQARVIEPAEYSGAILDGRVTQVKRAGRVKGSAQLQLSFEQIRLTDNRWTPLSAQVIEVIHSNTSQGVGDVDSEGGVRGQNTTKRDVTKVGAATGIGALIGAIAGGGKGAAIGAAIGAGVGTAGVITDDGEDIYLRQGQELRIRTARDATIG
ncbi:MAG: hypothetical protein QOE77_990 [Blastocatellia bacterium]|nr:hypothetical protein [Blastocatellia bacterium]